MKLLLIKKIIFFSIICFIFIEIIVRIFNLTNDIPQRKIDINGLQTYVENQNGYFNGNQWKVNKYGFIGLSEINYKNQVLIIGDSMIENIMNPIDCNQGSLLKKMFDNSYGFFEIGRSGLTLIESLEFYKSFNQIINPKIIIIYINEGDITESISNIKRFTDRLQINIQTRKLENVQIKYPTLKKILYNLKSIYFLYNRGFFNINSKNIVSNKQVKLNDNNLTIKKFFEIINIKYDLQNVTFVLDKSNKYIDLINTKKVILNNQEKNWFIKDDLHWNCFGHSEVAKKVFKSIIQSD